MLSPSKTASGSLHGAADKARLVGENLRLYRALRDGHGPRCTKPWTSLEERTSVGAVKPCCWLKQPLGQIVDETDVLPIWEGRATAGLRREMTAADAPAACAPHCPVLLSRRTWFGKQEFYEYSAAELRSYSTEFLGNRSRVMRAALSGDTDIPGALPLRLKVYPSNVCNLRCVMCFLDFETTVRRDWYDTMTFQRLLPFLEEIKVFGGEPFACKTSRALILERARPPHTHTSFVTNATLVDQRVIDRLERVRIGFVDVSLDAPDEATYTRIRLRGRFDRAVAGARRLADLGERHEIRRFTVNADYVIQEFNYRRIADFVSFCDDVGIVPNFSLISETPAAARRAETAGTVAGERPRNLLDLNAKLDHARSRAADLGATAAVASLERVARLLPGWT